LSLSALELIADIGNHMQFIPLQYRLLAINGVNIPWNAFLSLQNAKPKQVAKAEADLKKD